MHKLDHFPHQIIYIPQDIFCNSSMIDRQSVEWYITSSGVGPSLLKMRQFVRIIIIQSCTIKHELQIFDAVNIVMLDYDCRKRIIQALYAWASSVKRKLQIGKGSSFSIFVMDEHYVVNILNWMILKFDNTMLYKQKI